LEGSIAVAGSGVKFLINNLGISEDSEEVTELAGKVPDNGGCVFVTAFSGLFAPYWIDDAQGTIFGITAHVSTIGLSNLASVHDCRTEARVALYNFPPTVNITIFRGAMKARGLRHLTV
jgi:hypothetical protein